MAGWWDNLLSRWVWRASDGDNFIRNVPKGVADCYARAGIPLTPTTALQLAAVLCAVRVIAEGVAQVPLKVLHEDERDGKVYRRAAKDDPAFALLHRKPNGWQTSFEWREMMTIHAALCGNAYSVKSFVNGKLDELIPVHPDSMVVKFEHGTLSYRATIDGKAIDFDRKDVFHLRGPTLDGVLGIQTVTVARSILGLAMGLEQTQIDLHRKGGRPSGVLANKATTLSPEKKQELKDDWQKRFGPGGDGGIAVLDGGWEFATMMMTAVDAQLIENRRFQIEEVGRVFRVLPIMLMQADKASTFASAEQFFIAHVVHTLEPWIQRWEHALDRDVIDDDANYAHFQIQGLMRGAAADRAEYYAKGLGSGGSPAWLTQNDVRGMEDMDPHPDGDELFRGAQNAPPAPPAAPRPRPTPPAVSDEPDD